MRDKEVAQSSSNGKVDMLYTARSLAQKGKPVFPCNAKDKRPLIGGGHTNASIEPAQITHWWQQFPAAMIGLPTGTASGVFVVDCDLAKAEGQENGIEALQALYATYGEPFPPNTRTVATPSGGKHFYFNMPQGVDMRCSASQLAYNVDIRANGGYVIAGGTREDGKAYAIECDISPIDAPQWLVDKIQGLKKNNAPQGKHEPKKDSLTIPPMGEGTLHPYLAKIIQDECQAVASAPVGERNERLNKAAFCCGQRIAAGIPESLIWQELTRAAEIAGLQPTEIEKSLRSGLESGKEQPKEIPGNEKHHEIIIQSNEKQQEQEARSLSFLATPTPVPLEAFPPAIQTLLTDMAESHNAPLQIPTACLLALLSC